MDTKICPICGQDVRVVADDIGGQEVLIQHSPDGDEDEMGECPGSGMDVADIE